MPWKEKDNPFDPNPKGGDPQKRIPATGVTVKCHSPKCLKTRRNTSVNIRVETADNGHKSKHCRDCQWQWEVRVAPNGGVRVWQGNQFGAERREIPYEIFYQERFSR